MSNQPDSPLPWTLTEDVDRRQDRVLRIHDARGRELMHDERYYPSAPEEKADWEYIVRACNAHQALVDALQRAAVWVEHQTPNRMWSKPIEDDMRAEDVAMINAALQLAGVSEPKP